MSLDDKLRGLALTAALEIVNHPEVAVSIHGSTALAYHEDPVSLIQELIRSTFSAGLHFDAYNPLTAGPAHGSLEGSEKDPQGA